MRDIRLEEMPFELDGKTYLLRCNMNVFADVQEQFGGSIGEALSGEKPLQSVLAFLAAMLNDYADEQGWPERFTPKSIGRKAAYGQLPVTEIMRLVARAITPPSDPKENPPEDGSEGILETPENSGN